MLNDCLKTYLDCKMNEIHNDTNEKRDKNILISQSLSVEFLVNLLFSRFSSSVFVFASRKSVFTSANVTTHHTAHLSDKHLVSEQLKGKGGDNRKNTKKTNYIDLFSHILNQNV